MDNIDLVALNYVNRTEGRKRTPEPAVVVPEGEIELGPVGLAVAVVACGLVALFRLAGALFILGFLLLITYLCLGGLFLALADIAS